MSWNRKARVLLLASLSSCSLQPVSSAEICPSRSPHSLRFVDVFDGLPNELATLVPDEAHERSGYWQLGYIYDAGRFVTINCKYEDGKKLEVELHNRVNRCDYRIDRKHVLSLNCK
jgi:hypothetical protein